jgi:hypothetical protein
MIASFTPPRASMYARKTLRAALVAMTIGLAAITTGCVMSLAAPVAVDGYEPVYYHGHVVYYDGGGAPFVYHGTRMYYVPRRHVHYGVLRHHYQAHRRQYYRWYAREGYRYKQYRYVAHPRR